MPKESDVALTDKIREGAYAVVQYVRKNRATFYVARIEKIVKDKHHCQILQEEC